MKLEKNAIKIPNTILNWKRPVNLPRSPAGEISEINSGAAIVEIPIPIPPMNLKKKNDDTSQAIAEPIAPTKKSMPLAIKVFLRPYLAAGIEPIKEPSTVPQRAAEIARPCIEPDNDQSC